MTPITRMVVALSFLLASSASHAGPFAGLAVFGDSLADAGNNAVLFDTYGALLTPPVPPGTRTPTPIPNALTDGSVIPTFPYGSDRYSNGPVWVEQFAASLGLSAQASLLGGTNFAFGGARTGPAGSLLPPSLLDQVTAFLAGTGGSAPSDWLYIVIGGGNDLRDVQTGVPPADIVANYAANVGMILTQLTVAGADHILLANVPDLGLTPAFQLLDMVTPGTAAFATGLAMEMNQALLASLAGMDPEVVDGIVFLDLFGLLNGVAQDPAIDSTLICAADLACVSDPGNVFFWDGVHATTFGHSVLAAAALRAIPEPATLALLVAAMFVLGWARSRPTDLRRSVTF